VEISSDTPGTFQVKITNLSNNSVVFGYTLSGGSFNGGNAGLYSLDGQADFDNFYLELK
jgi:hypothetical protein